MVSALNRWRIVTIILNDGNHPVAIQRSRMILTLFNSGGDFDLKLAKIVLPLLCFNQWKIFYSYKDKYECSINFNENNKYLCSALVLFPTRMNMFTNNTPPHHPFQFNQWIHNNDQGLAQVLFESNHWACDHQNYSEKVWDFLKTMFLHDLSGDCLLWNHLR